MNEQNENTMEEIVKDEIVTEEAPRQRTPEEIAKRRAELREEMFASTRKKIEERFEKNKIFVVTHKV